MAVLGSDRIHVCFSRRHPPLRFPPSSSICASRCWTPSWPTSAPRSSTTPCTGPSPPPWAPSTSHPSRRPHPSIPRRFVSPLLTPFSVPQGAQRLREEEEARGRRAADHPQHPAGGGSAPRRQVPGQPGPGILQQQRHRAPHLQAGWDAVIGWWILWFSSSNYCYWLDSCVRNGKLMINWMSAAQIWVQEVNNYLTRMKRRPNKPAC